MNLPTTIDDVLDHLDEIIEETIRDANYLGVFAYVYRRTTAEIQRAIQDEEFEDNERMESMDVGFANLYIKAYQALKRGELPPQAWALSFDNRKEGLSLLQHALLGMNAHINLDLGLATASAARGSAIQAIRNDFLKVNEILFRITEEMQERLGKASPLLFLLDWAGGRKDEQFVDFSMIKARDFAWNLAEDLADLPKEKWDARIQQADFWVTELGKRIVDPPGRLIPWVLRFIALFETRDAQSRMDKMRSNP